MKTKTFSWRNAEEHTDQNDKIPFIALCHVKKVNEWESKNPTDETINFNHATIHRYSSPATIGFILFFKKRRRSGGTLKHSQRNGITRSTQNLKDIVCRERQTDNVLNEEQSFHILQWAHKNCVSVRVWNRSGEWWRHKGRK